MPRVKLTKSAIDALPTPAKDIIYWDSGCPCFGVKITPKGRKVFIVLYRAGGAGSRLRKGGETRDVCLWHKADEVEWRCNGPLLTQSGLSRFCFGERGCCNVCGRG